jgi:hypothetical protein
MATHQFWMKVGNLCCGRRMRCIRSVQSYIGYFYRGYRQSLLANVIIAHTQGTLVVDKVFVTYHYLGNTLVSYVIWGVHSACNEDYSLLRCYVMLFVVDISKELAAWVFRVVRKLFQLAVSLSDMTSSYKILSFALNKENRLFAWCEKCIIWCTLCWKRDVRYGENDVASLWLTDRQTDGQKLRLYVCTCSNKTVRSWWNCAASALCMRLS